MSCNLNVNLLGSNFAGFIMFKLYLVLGFDNWNKLSSETCLSDLSKKLGIFVQFSSTLLLSFIQIVRIFGKLKSKGKMRQLQDEPPSKLVIALIELVAHRSEHVRAVARTHEPTCLLRANTSQTTHSLYFSIYMCSIFCFH